MRSPPAACAHDHHTHRGKVRSLQDACSTLRSHTALLLSDIAADVEGRGEGPAVEVAGAAKRLQQVGVGCHVWLTVQQAGAIAVSY
jgi:hypothetical protein